MVVVGGGLVVVVVLGAVVVVVGGGFEGDVVVVGRPGSWSSRRRRWYRASRPATRSPAAAARHRTTGCPGGRRDRSAGRARGRGRRRARCGRSGRRGGLRPDGRDGAHVVHRLRRKPWLGASGREGDEDREQEADDGEPRQHARPMGARPLIGLVGELLVDQLPRVAVRHRRAAFARVGPDPVLVHVDPFLVPRQRRWFPPEETACGQEAYVRLRRPAAGRRRTAVDGPWPRN